MAKNLISLGFSKKKFNPNDLHNLKKCWYDDNGELHIEVHNTPFYYEDADGICFNPRVKNYAEYADLFKKQYKDNIHIFIYPFISDKNEKQLIYERLHKFAETELSDKIQQKFIEAIDDFNNTNFLQDRFYIWVIRLLSMFVFGIVLLAPVLLAVFYSIV